ncbi:MULTISPECIES: hypothetical protein [unclassified Paenibacillus]|uniref:hypothetical protein n=1 Tax=unclassified Paenibacillus TaxID=185978 RepID=UPI00240496B4|nr:MULTISPECIES: hypothetical protein [unclassified Paenibacillus]MDF9842145.1 hypothetical protein [Paenibacillus sp. PastF-2]MDF9848601.1 hypothetical protein [Paenibacillus sp. PastM-2]MDF9855170.1 hypothetical protein [Paenibacillus sp. PastF-1]MDH6480440.1 hypothetical protein [Paenibacillus sp. PastH-2]MDH6507868.1 hypothetical protein [Paenibacillus sp. PastM-3]
MAAEQPAGSLPAQAGIKGIFALHFGSAGAHYKLSGKMLPKSAKSARLKTLDGKSTLKSAESAHDAAFCPN